MIKKTETYKRKFQERDSYVPGPHSKTFLLENPRDGIHPFMRLAMKQNIFFAKIYCFDLHEWAMLQPVFLNIFVMNLLRKSYNTKTPYISGLLEVQS
jgi:hypothetical protein